MSYLFEPQNLSLGFEIWFLVLLMASLATYATSVVTGLSWALLWPMLAFGGYGGNVVGRAQDWLTASSKVTPDAVLDSTYASLAGMFVVMMVYFFFKLVMPVLLEPKLLQRAGQPKSVVGQFD